MVWTIPQDLCKLLLRQNELLYFHNNSVTEVYIDLSEGRYSRLDGQIEKNNEHSQ